MMHHEYYTHDASQVLMMHPESPYQREREKKRTDQKEAGL
jgi:hypothetical protein